MSSPGSIECDGLTPNHCSTELTYTPDEDYNGSDSFTFTATSDGSPSPSATVSITVDPVNDTPSFTVGPDVTVNEDSVLQRRVHRERQRGPGRRVRPIAHLHRRRGQHGAVRVTARDLGRGRPHLHTGSRRTRVHLGLGPPGRRQPVVERAGFSITITSVNDKPSFTKGPNVIAANVGATTRSGWATSITDGGGESDNLAFVLAPADAALFTAGPAVDASSGDLTYTPSGAAGSTSVTVRRR